MKKEDFQEIKKLIASGKENLAIEHLLRKSARTKIENDVIRLSNRYQKLNKEFLNGLITKESRDVELNTINSAILNIEGRLWSTKKRSKSGRFALLLLVVFLIVFLISKSLFDDSDLLDFRDGKRYKTTIINDLEWLSENISFKINDDSWCYNNMCKTSNRYGRLYNFEGALYACTGLGEGWRLPTKQELVSLKSYLEKEQNSMNFDNFLGGEMGLDGTFLYLKENGILWSSTRSKGDYIWAMYLHGDSKLIEIIDHGAKTYGYSCRCVKNIKN
ncbi:FISUMP domain-containing protein [Haliscomenobacter sp.]|uniref:FISUMP domain-containing protein n=1 Tax=Haliscomenobacter sp. TaxID=2717303 RepID=UPI003593E06C